MQQQQNHPLKTKYGSHYAMPDGREAIENLELLFTKEQLKSWSLINSYRYRLRIGKKDDIEKEIIKIKSYEAYYKYLNEGIIDE